MSSVKDDEALAEGA